jgi:hypothetical protein
MKTFGTEKVFTVYFSVDMLKNNYAAGAKVVKVGRYGQLDFFKKRKKFDKRRDFYARKLAARSNRREKLS